ncbi:MAG: DUF5067 domain-containing protein [Eubacteriales bacterium]|nr:DUF5067 domain-containing protein [Eubacteriales bacterium]
MKKKLITTLLAVSMAMAPIGVAAEDNSARIAEIEAQIAELQAELDGLKGGQEAETADASNTSDFVYETDTAVFAYKDKKVVESGDNKYIELIFDYTNNGDEANSAFFSAFANFYSRIEAYQDGIELDSTSFIGFGDDEAMKMSTTDVKPGTTVEVALAFKLNNDSEVSIEFQKKDELLQPIDDSLQTLTLSVTE